jgi:Zn-dependent metalloprotease
VTCLLSLLLGTFFPLPAAAQAEPPIAASDETVDAGIQRLGNDAGGSVQVSRSRATGVATFVGLPDTAAPVGLQAQEAAPATKSMTFLQQYGSIFGIENANAELQQVSTETDFLGDTHLVYQQVYQGVAVFAGTLRVHVNAAGRLTAANGVFIPDLKLSTTPTLPADAAAAIAEQAVLAQNRLSAVSTEITVVSNQLYIFRAGLIQGILGRNHLVYQVEVENPAHTVHEFVFVDAHTGDIVEQYAGIQRAINRQVYNGGFDASFLVWSEGDLLPYNTGGPDDASINNLISFTEDTYNLYATLSDGRFLSWDGRDAAMPSVLNTPGLTCPGAYWNGATTNFCSSVATDDLVGHEWSHAYTDGTHSLIYRWQPGALNEAYSDIFGEVVDLLNGAGIDSPNTLRSDGACSPFDPTNPASGASVRWLFGENNSGYYYDLWNPNCSHRPGKVSDSQYWCYGADDGGVHTNSGVPNHAFALLVDGGSYNGQTISGIGLTKAAHIFWRAETVYQGPTTGFSEHADALEQSCNDLIGVDLPGLSTDTPIPFSSGEQISAANCAELSKVIAAVEYRTEPTQCTFAPLLDPNAPPLCADPNTPPTAIDVIDWESGLDGWTVGRRDILNPATFDTPDWAVVGNLPDSRSGLAAFVADSPGGGNCFTGDSEAGALFLESPVIALPADALVPRVVFDHWLATELEFDGGNVKVSVNGGPWQLVPPSAFDFNPYNAELDAFFIDNPLHGEPAFAGTDDGQMDGSWGRSLLNLLGIAQGGDTIQLRFEFGADSCRGVVGWYVDEVQTYYCAGEEPPPNIEITPAGLTASQEPGAQSTQLLTITNTGLGGLEWSINEATDPPTGALASFLQRPDLAAQSARQARLGHTPPQAQGDPAATMVALPGLPTGVLDGSFEAGSPNPFWDEFSTNFGTPLCNTECTAAGALTGDWWAWFGGVAGAYEAGSLTQAITIPVHTTTLRFYLALPVCDSAADYLAVLLDGNELFRVNGSSNLCWVAGYSQQTVDISAYADGGVHTLVFNSETFSNNGNVSNIFVDDVAIDLPEACDFPPSAVSWLAATPTNGSTPSGGQSTIEVTFDSTGLAPGRYKAALCVASNDLDTPLMQVPVTLTVGHNVLYLSASAGGSVAGIRFNDEDILGYDPANGEWWIYFDGSNVGLKSVDVDAFEVLNDGNLILSFDKPVTIDGVTYDDSAVLLFTGASFGRNNTTGDFSLYFDGSLYGLTTADEDIDGLAFTPAGNLVVSVLGKFGNNPPDMSGGDEDLFVFQDGAWQRYFDGSDNRMTKRSEDLWGVWIDPLTGGLYLSTAGDYKVTGDLSGDHDDVFVCSPTSLFADTTCTNRPFFDGDAVGFKQRIDGVSLALAFPVSPNVATATLEEVEVDDESEDIDDGSEAEESQQLYLPLIQN